MIALKPLALPVEHGGWGFLIEPIALGLLLAPSAAGAFLGLAALGAFLVRHPLRLAMGDRHRGTRGPRTLAAEGVALVYALIAACGLAAAVANTDAPLWIPVVCAAPLGAVQILYDARLRSRDLAPELAGSVALGATAAAIALAGGFRLRAAFVLWLLLAIRSVTAVLYVRARIRLDRGLATSVAAVWCWHVAGLAFAGALAVAGEAPWLGVAAIGALLARALHGLSRLRQPVRPQVLGFQELGFGLLSVALLALGYSLDV